jgi:predicted dehydrogenase
VQRSADRPLAVVFQQRTGSAAAHVKALLESGSLGRPLVAVAQTMWYRDDVYYKVPWRGRFAAEGGGTTMSHSICLEPRPRLGCVSFWRSAKVNDIRPLGPE